MTTATQILERKFGVILKHAGGNEWCGPCPFCVPGTLTGEDRFRVWEGTGKEGVGSYWCRQCDARGFADKLEGDDLTEEQRLLRRTIAEQERQARKQAELERRLSALERMALCTDHVTYHDALDKDDRRWWHEQGINDDSIDAYQLGICYGCPTHPDHPISMTIPVFDSTRERLVNIRHRIVGATNGDRYRPHMAGLPASLFNAHLVRTESDIVLVEGEKKAIVVTQNGFPAVGMFGKSSFNLGWLPHFTAVRRLWVALDPDAREAEFRLGKAVAQATDIEVRTCGFIVKPDDFFLRGGDADDFEAWLSYGRRVA